MKKIRYALCVLLVLGLALVGCTADARQDGSVPVPSAAPVDKAQLLDYFELLVQYVYEPVKTGAEADDGTLLRFYANVVQAYAVTQDTNYHVDGDPENWVHIPTATLELCAEGLLGVGPDAMLRYQEHKFVHSDVAIEHYMPSTDSYAFPPDLLVVPDNIRFDREAVELGQDGSTVTLTAELAPTGQPENGRKLAYAFEQMEYGGQVYYQLLRVTAL